MIPESIDHVTTSWVSEVLQSDVRNIRRTQIGQGVGIMGDIFRIDLDHSDPSTPRSVVVKLPSSWEENRAQGVALGMFEAEVKFYRELAQKVPVGLPYIHLAEIESGTANFIIVMEDLNVLTMVNQSDGVTLDQALMAVEVLAIVHSVWWDQADSEELAWIPNMIGPRIQFVDGLLLQILEPFCNAFAEHLPPGGKEMFEAFAGNYVAINKTLANRSPWTLAHQDFRVENMLFGKDRVVVLDWQGIGRGPGSYDLAYFLGGSMNIDLRRAHEREIVAHYYDKLMERGIKGYSPEQLWSDYQLGHLQGGLATSMVTGGSMDLSNDRGRELIATMSNRHVTAALDHGGPAILDQCVS